MGATTRRNLTSTTLMPLVCLWTITTMLVSSTTTAATRLVSRQLRSLLSLLVAFHSPTTVLSNTMLVATTPTTVNLSGRTWTPLLTSIRSSPRSTPSARPLRSGTRSRSNVTRTTPSTLTLVASSSLPSPTLVLNSARSLTIHSMRERPSATSSTPLLTANKFLVASTSTFPTESPKSTFLNPNLLPSLILSLRSSVTPMRSSSSECWPHIKLATLIPYLTSA